MKRISKGFTLIELMIVVAIIGIVSAVAVPQYNEYVMRARLTEAFTALADARSSVSNFWNNGNTYVGANMPAPSKNFTYALSNDSASTFTVTAKGEGLAAGFTYTVDQQGARTTVSPWGNSATCWIDRKDGSCLQ